MCFFIQYKCIYYKKISGTPLHQPEEDQQIHPNALHQQVPPLAPMGSLTPTLGLGMTVGVIPPPTKQNSYVTNYITPQSMMQPQTPVSDLNILKNSVI